MVSAARTPLGSFCGTLASVSAPQLGAVVVRAVVERAGIDKEAIDEVIMGNVISAGLGQNPARQAALRAGMPSSVAATTVNKVCGSGMKSIALGEQAIRAGAAKLVVAGGMESMSGAPHLLLRAREGYRMGNGELVDSMIRDGLTDVYGNQHMGVYGDLCAAKCGFTREQQDDFAEESYARAQKAIQEGVFDEELVPVEVTVRKKTTIVDRDEEPARFDPRKLRELRPAFSPEGTITAGNASSISDGAAAVLIGSAETCGTSGLRPLAKIAGCSTHSREPEWFSLAPIDAIQKLLDQVGWSVPSVDLFEINEAFATVAMAAAKELEIPREKLNIYGGAVALGHPIGCSGTRLVVTLLNALRRTGGKKGVACLCIGGGEAIAMALERTP